MMNAMTLFLAAILLNIFAYLTIRLRPIIYHVKLFKPMIWNFKLSLMPLMVLLLNALIFLILVVVSNALNQVWIRILGQGLFVVGMVVWMLLLPNSGYLITELNLTHRDQDEHPVPIWYDIISIMSFALSGIVNTLVNIVMIQLMVLIAMDPSEVGLKWQGLLLGTALIINLLVSIGVYLGRYIRFNSWDILHPLSFVRKFIAHFKIKGKFKEFSLFVVFHTTFFMILYFSFGIHQYFILSGI